jgi:hypothetical protein
MGVVPPLAASAVQEGIGGPSFEQVNKAVSGAGAWMARLPMRTNPCKDRVCLLRGSR